MPVHLEENAAFAAAVHHFTGQPVASYRRQQAELRAGKIAGKIAAAARHFRQKRAEIWYECTWPQ